MLLEPAALWLLASIAALLWLRLRRRPRRVVAVSSLALWPAPAAGARPRLVLRRFLREPSLLLQIAFLVAVVLALARPVVQGAGAETRRVVLILDGSASMAAAAEQRTRFDMARESAERVIRRLRRGDRARLLYADRQPRFVSEPSTDHADLRRRLHQLAPGAGPADLVTAAVMGLAATEAGGADVVYVFSDGTASARLPDELRLPRLRYERVGGPLENLAITRIASRPSRVSPFDNDLFIEVANHSGRARAAALRVSVGGRRVRSERLLLAGDERRSLVVEGLGATGPTTLEAELEVDDALALDNRAWEVLSGGGYSVLLVGRADRFLEPALALDPLVRLSRTDVDGYSPEQAAAFDVVVFAGVRPELSPGCPRLVFWPSQYRRRPLGASVPLPARGHPMASWVGFAGLPTARAVVVPAGAGWTVLLENQAGPLVLARETGTRELVVGLDPTDPSWGRTLSFPAFVANAVRWLASGEGGSRSQVVAGELLEWRLPGLPATAEVTVEDPLGTRIHAQLRDGRLSFGRTGTPGVYTVRAAGLERRFAVNPASLSESDLRPVRSGPEGEVAAVRGGQVDPKAELSRAVLSRWLLGIALVLLSCEWLLWQRQAGEGAL